MQNKYASCPYNFNWIDNNDIETIRERITSEQNDAELDITDILNDLSEDGSFKSIDYYTDKKDTWHPAKHLENILKMQIACHTPENSFYQNEKS